MPKMFYKKWQIVSGVQLVLVTLHGRPKISNDQNNGQGPRFKETRSMLHFNNFFASFFATSQLQSWNLILCDRNR